MQQASRVNPVWHSLPAAEVLHQLASQPGGLATSEVRARLQRHGPNRLTPPKRRGLFKRFLLQFHNILIYVLLMAAVVTALLAHWVDSSVILGVVLINAIIGVIQEGKAEKALDAIRHMLSRQTQVRRDDQLMIIPSDELVPGDIVTLQSGDKIPADIRLLTARELHVDEALLTGESVPVHKSSEPVSATATLGDRKSMLFSGTLVTAGQARGVVVTTGDNTELGRISSLLREVETLTTPLLRQMASFARWLTLAILLFAVAAFLLGFYLHGNTAAEMFMAAVGLAVAAIPEGLPAIMTITLAIGVKRMADRHAIIRRLPAVETLGCVNVICSDKTGTLTRNEMTVRSALTATEQFDITGTGYSPHGEFLSDGEPVHPDNFAALMELVRAVLLCNDAGIRQKDNEWHLTGDPTEGALISFGMKAGIDPHHLLQEWPRMDVIPFESEHRYMATLHHDTAGHGCIYVKGAPERVLEMCHAQRVHGDDLPLDHAYWESRMQAMAVNGLRLLAIACKPASAAQQKLHASDVASGLTLLGVVGMMDPPRQEAIDAVRACQQAGIKVKMITGDHLVTASAVGVALGIGDGRTAVAGRDLEKLGDAELRAVARDHAVFARTSPEDKLRLVTALQADGYVVAMTGDGVNDAPALKRADIGIAMGHKGTEVSKEAAGMVLADDNFATIVNAVEEGRIVYDNLRKSILYILPTSGGEALSVLAAIALGTILPITPVQILWINMVTAVTLSLTLAFEPAESLVMTRPPRNVHEPLLSRMLVWRCLLVSCIMVACSFGVFLWYYEQGGSPDLARTMAVNTLVMCEIFYLFNARFLLASSLSWRGLFGNRYVLYAIGILLVVQLLFTYAPFMQRLFHTRPITLQDWLLISVVALSVFIVVEIEKALLRWRETTRNH